MAVRDKQLRGRRACVNAMCTQLTFVHVLLVFSLKGGNPLWQMFQLSVPKRARQLSPIPHPSASADSHLLPSSSARPTLVYSQERLSLLAWLYSMAVPPNFVPVCGNLKPATLLGLRPSLPMEHSGFLSPFPSCPSLAVRAWPIWQARQG